MQAKLCLLSQLSVLHYTFENLRSNVFFFAFSFFQLSGFLIVFNYRVCDSPKCSSFRLTRHRIVVLFTSVEGDCELYEPLTTQD